MSKNGPKLAPQRPALGPNGPMVLAQVIYNPADNTLGIAFAPFVDNPAMAAADVIKACANVIQAAEMQKSPQPAKPQILVPSMVLR